MGSWTANRLRAMLCGRLSIDEINIISEKHGGPDTMFAMVRSLDEEQAKIFLYNILNEGLSARLSAFAETVNVSENDLQQVIDHYGGPSNLCHLLDFYSWPTLTYLPTMLKYRKKCPVKLGPYRTLGTGTACIMDSEMVLYIIPSCKTVRKSCLKIWSINPNMFYLMALGIQVIFGENPAILACSCILDIAVNLQNHANLITMSTLNLLKCQTRSGKDIGWN